MEDTWTEWAYSQFVAVDEYREIREEMLKLLSSSIFEYLQSTSEYDLPSTGKLKKIAYDESGTIPEFVFPEPLHQIRLLLNRVKNFIIFTTLLILVVSAYFSVQWIEQLTLQTLSVIELITSFAFLPPSLAAVVMLYLYAIRSDKIFKRRLGQDMLIPAGRVRASDRDTPQLFSFAIWNRSLNSSGIYFALGTLVIIKTLSSSFYKFIFRVMNENVDVFLEQGQISSTIYALYKNRK